MNNAFKSVLITTVLVVASVANTRSGQAEIVSVGDVSPDPTFPLAVLGQRLYVGEAASGSLRIDTGSQVNSAGGSLGRFEGASGQVNITGDGSNWDTTFVTSPTFYVGVRGRGELRIDQGGSLVSGRGRVASEITGSGTVLLDGVNSNWINQGLNIGDRSDGEMTISGGAKSVTTGNSRIGSETGASGTVTIRGSGSEWTNTEYLTVGNDGNGSLEILDGALLTNTSTNIASKDGSDSSVLVSGSGSRWLTSDSLRLASGGGGPNPSSASLTINGGGLVRSAEFASVAVTEGSTASVVIDGASSRWEHSGELSVGISGTATLDISGGGTLATNEGHVGFSFNGRGDVSVTGENSRWDNETELWVGTQSPGTLGANQGAVVTTEKSYIGIINRGEVTVAGKSPDSGDASHLQIRDEAVIGGFAGGMGLLNVSDHATAKIGGDLVLGFDGGVGEVTVDTSAQLELRGVTTIGAGEFSAGSLTISGEGEVDAYDDFVLALNAGSTGTLKVETDGVLNMHGNDIRVGDGIASINFLGGTVRNIGAFRTHLGHTGGTLAAGASPGTMEIQGDYTQGEAAILEIELANFSDFESTPGVDFDFYYVDGIANLMGTLDVLADGIYSPAIGDSFEVLDAASIRMRDVTFTGLPGLQYEVIAKAGGREALVLSFVPEPSSFAVLALMVGGILTAKRRRRTS